MHILSRKTVAAIVLVLPTAVLAIANLTVTRLTDGCASYPGYNSSTDIAGPWPIYSDSTGNDAINGLQLSAASFTNDGKDRFGFITLPKQPPRLGSQTITFRCAASKLQALLPTAQFYPDQPTPEPVYVDVVISTEENWQAAFAFNLSPSIPVEAYKHSIDGEEVDGVFLGANGNTEVALKYNWGGNAGEYYLVRLKGGVGSLGRAMRRGKRQDFPVLDDRDWTGFVRVLG